MISGPPRNWLVSIQASETLGCGQMSHVWTLAYTSWQHLFISEAQLGYITRPGRGPEREKYV